MNLNNAIMDILFRQINPEEILAEYRNRPTRTLSQLCMTKAESVLSGYSFEEKESVIQSFLHAKNDNDTIWRDPPSQLKVIAEQADKIRVPPVDMGP